METHTLLWRLYWACPAQQAAHACLTGELARKGLNVKSPHIATTWHRFTADVILHLSLFGYVITRQLKSNQPQIYPGQLATIKRVAAGVWQPVTPNPDPVFQGTGWTVTMLFEPVFSRNGDELHPTSPGFKTIHQSMAVASLKANMQTRDMRNTDPAIWTSLSNSIQANKGSAIPWHRNIVESAHIAGQHPLPTGPTHANIADYVTARAEAIRQLDHVTDFARQHNAPAHLGEPPESVEVAHQENIVSDGRDYKECRHLQQDTIIVHQTIDRLDHEIMFSWGVPPQVLGKNINSERLASSNRLTEMAINHYFVTTKGLTEIMAGLYRTMTKTGVAFGTCVSIHVIEQCGQYLKPESAVALYACAFDLDESLFDITKFDQVDAPARTTEATKDAKRNRAGYG